MYLCIKFYLFNFFFFLLLVAVLNFIQLSKSLIYFSVSRKKSHEIRTSGRIGSGTTEVELFCKNLVVLVFWTLILSYHCWFARILMKGLFFRNCRCVPSSFSNGSHLYFVWNLFVLFSIHSAVVISSSLLHCFVASKFWNRLCC